MRERYESNRWFLGIVMFDFFDMANYRRFFEAWISAVKQLKLR